MSIYTAIVVCVNALKIAKSEKPRQIQKFVDLILSKWNVSMNCNGKLISWLTKYLIYYLGLRQELGPRHTLTHNITIVRYYDNLKTLSQGFILAKVSS